MRIAPTQAGQHAKSSAVNLPKRCCLPPFGTDENLLGRLLPTR